MTDGHHCTPSPGSNVTQAAIDESCRYQELCEQVAHVMGAINVAVGQLVELAHAAVAEGLAGGYGIPSEADWLAWRTGLSKMQCNSILKLAKRRDELPATFAALANGELTLDQAAEVARHVPSEHEASAAEFAKLATVAQLRSNLSRFGFEKPERRPDPEPDPDTGGPSTGGVVHRGRDDRGWRLDARLPDDEAALVDKALEWAREDLYQQRRRETPEGESVAPVTWAEALTAMAATSLASGQAAHPGSDRYQVHLHLQAGAEGPVLANHLGVAVPDSVRRLILCDCAIRATTWDRLNPLDVGRLTRVVSRRMRRAIEHRDGGCTAPGCRRTTGLHIHHIVHWEDGGPTDTGNLLTLCNTHHRLHHEGLLGIARTPGVDGGEPGWITFTDPTGRRIERVGSPDPRYRPAPTPASSAPNGATPPRRHDPHRPVLDEGTPAAHAHRAAQAIGLTPIRYDCPVGGRINPRDITLSPSSPPRPPRPPNPAEPSTTPDPPGSVPPDSSEPAGRQPAGHPPTPPSPTAPTAQPVNHAPPSGDPA